MQGARTLSFQCRQIRKRHAQLSSRLPAHPRQLRTTDRRRPLVEQDGGLEPDAAGGIVGVGLGNRQHPASHSININWKDGKPQQKIQLPAGQLTFTATRTYTDNFANYASYPTRSITVSVADKDAAPGPNDNSGGEDHWDSEHVQIEVKNVAPSFAHNMTVTKASGNPRKVTIEGDIIDPGADSFQVFAKWGDSQLNPFNQGDTCTMSKRHFKCEHQYAPAPVRGFTVELTARDDDGGTTKKSVHVSMP
jgi:hypothetical protein